MYMGQLQIVTVTLLALNEGLDFNYEIILLYYCNIIRGHKGR